MSAFPLPIGPKVPDLTEREMRVLRSFRVLLQTDKCASLTVIKGEDGQIQIFVGQAAGLIKA